MKFRIIVPARFASSRLPGKPLADIAGKPMVVRVLERALESGAEEVIAAVDDQRVLEAVEGAGHRAVMTSVNHASGTDRLAEVVERLDFGDDDIFVNVQGDEPLIQPSLIRECAASLATHDQAAISTLAHPLHSLDEFRNPNVVKLVMDELGYALYFSRAPIPWPRDAFAAGESLPEGLPVFRHIGLYAYRAGFLRAFAGLTPSPLERYEMLEQLRALWHGYRIAVSVTPEAPGAGVDTPEDLERVRQVFAG